MTDFDPRQLSNIKVPGASQHSRHDQIAGAPPGRIAYLRLADPARLRSPAYYS